MAQAPSPRYIIRHGIKKTQIGGHYTTQHDAEAAAIAASQTAGASVSVWWLDDTGTPTTEIAFAYRGELTHI